MQHFCPVGYFEQMGCTMVSRRAYMVFTRVIANHFMMIVETALLAAYANGMHQLTSRYIRMMLNVYVRDMVSKTECDKLQAFMLHRGNNKLDIKTEKVLNSMLRQPVIQDINLKITKQSAGVTMTMFTWLLLRWTKLFRDFSKTRRSPLTVEQTIAFFRRQVFTKIHEQNPMKHLVFGGILNSPSTPATLVR